MCDDHEDAAARVLPRRRVLQGAVALGGLLGLAGVAGISRTLGSAAPLAVRPTSADALSAYQLAMHVHASASEGLGSVHAQMLEAARNNFDVLWFTEHDWRRRRLLFRPAYHFLSNDTALGGRWTVGKMANVGSLTSTSGGTLVTTASQVSPSDPANPKGSLRLRATSTGSAAGTLRYRVNTESASRANVRARIAGRTVTVDVLPTRAGANAWAQVRFGLSRHPAGPNRPAGALSLLYRLRTDITTAPPPTAQGLNGTIDLPLQLNTWNQVPFDLETDVARVWPDLQAVDNSLQEIEFHCTSRARTAGEVFFSYLRFDEKADYDALGVEQTLIEAYQNEAPDLLGLVGTEISLGPHINQYGGDQLDYPYQNATSLTSDLGEIRASVVDFIHQCGGAASINHPFKPGDTGQLATAQAVAADQLRAGAGGADIIEIGYANKHGGDLGEHLQVWDTLSRNGLFLTANGVSDDHGGQNWASQANRFYTGAWAAEKSPTALLQSLRTGRGFVGLLGTFTGTVDMDLDGGSVLMGQVSADSGASRELRIDVNGVPTGGGVQVLRGVVDRPGPTDPTPNTQVVHTRSGSGVTTLTLDTGVDCFHRLQVVNSTGAVVAFGQPIWTYTGTPTTTPPQPRLATG